MKEVLQNIGIDSVKCYWKIKLHKHKRIAAGFSILKLIVDFGTGICIGSIHQNFIVVCYNDNERWGPENITVQMLSFMH